MTVAAQAPNELPSDSALKAGLALTTAEPGGLQATRLIPPLPTQNRQGIENIGTAPTLPHRQATRRDHQSRGLPAIYVGETDDAPGAALLGLLLMIGLVAFAVKIARRKA